MTKPSLALVGVPSQGGPDNPSARDGQQHYRIRAEWMQYPAQGKDLRNQAVRVVMLLPETGRTRRQCHW